MADGPRFKLVGDEAMSRNLAALAVAFPEAALAALRLEAEIIMTNSKNEYVPVDIGNLRGSGKVLPAEREGDEMRVQLTYGDASAPYALAVHEHPSTHSPPTWQGKAIRFKRGGPKYLERPLMEARAGMASRLAGRIKRAVGAS